MMINCGPPLDERLAARDERKKAYLSQWHPFFALWPRRIGASRCVWLEWIRRKGRYIDNGYHGGEWVWEYRLSLDREMTTDNPSDVT